MKFTVLWHPAHTTQVRNMNPWIAAAVCKAVYAAAETGKGTIRRIHPDNPFRISIHVPGAVAFADVDPDTLTMKILRILPSATPPLE